MRGTGVPVLVCRDGGFSPSGKDAVVHLHAYVCADWKSVVRRDVKKGRADREMWKYSSFTPNVNSTTVKGNANVQKAQCLFYCMVDKIGGVCSEPPIW